MRRDDVPEQDIVLDPELDEDAMHDRRGRLRGAGAGQLALRRKGHAADARAAIARRFADENDLRSRTLLEIRTKPVAAQLRTRVLIVRRADARACKPVDEIHVSSLSGSRRDEAAQTP